MRVVLYYVYAGNNLNIKMIFINISYIILQIKTDKAHH